MCKLESEKFTKEQWMHRNSLDIVFVIDKSKDFSDSRLDEIIISIKKLVGHLRDNDRISIISFNDKATRECKLIKMDLNGISTVNTILLNLQPSGEPNINEGLNLALKVLNERRFKNSVSSIFIISDGDQNDSWIKIQETINLYKDIENY